MAPAPDKDEALAWLRARAAEWTTANCELVICTCELGDAIRDLLAVLEDGD